MLLYISESILDKTVEIKLPSAEIELLSAEIEQTCFLCPDHVISTGCQMTNFEICNCYVFLTATEF